MKAVYFIKMGSPQTKKRSPQTKKGPRTLGNSTNFTFLEATDKIRYNENNL